MKAPARRDLREEADHLPDSIEELMGLRDRVIELGESRGRAEGLCMWVLAKRTGEPDATSSRTRAYYRSILRRLNELEPAGPTRTGRTARPRRDDGATDPKTAALVAAGAAAGLLLAHATGNPILALVAPIIPDDVEEPRYVDSTVWDELGEAA